MTLLVADNALTKRRRDRKRARVFVGRRFRLPILECGQAVSPAGFRLWGRRFRLPVPATHHSHNRSSPMTEPSTPLMRQYHGIKQQVPNTLLMFRLGDFYELFYDDAVTAARELEITLTARNKEKGQPIPMCGVPYHASENYIARLIQKGYRVAICDQMEDPKLTKTLVRREVTRIVTPGTAMNASVLRSHENNYLAAVFPGVIQGIARAGIAHVDVSTGEFRATEIRRSPMSLPRSKPSTPARLSRPKAPPLNLPCLKTEIEPWVFGADYAARSLCDHFHLLALDGCGLENRPLATGAAAAILHYLRDTQRTALDHLERPTFYDRADALVLDATTVRNLELVEPLFAGESKESTLLHVLDRTRTGMGGRLLAPPSARAFHRHRRNRSASRCRRRTPRQRDSARRARQGSRVDPGSRASARQSSLCRPPVRAIWPRWRDPSP